MKNKNLIYIIGGLAVIGIGYVIYKKRKAIERPNENDGSGETKSKDITPRKPRPTLSSQVASNQNILTNLASALSPATPTAPPTAPPTSTSAPIQLNNLEVEKRIFTACGIKPSGLFKERRNQWDNCKDRTKADLRTQGLISFDGDFYTDFDGNDVYGL
jgi:hypothetical protein